MHMHYVYQQHKNYNFIPYLHTFIDIHSTLLYTFWFVAFLNYLIVYTSKLSYFVYSKWYIFAKR